ncbi:glucanase [Kineosporia sp. NBRC 101677]|uniref:glycoside hydrolase family 6 protein n=1 Tax=Kineosporia sp. NBRC 101677 TaxID=3032197 RepID=UPI0024A20424|nr:glycoside hydrolase family 6 protein [Kineosporia sp. NBRC 101677]GLY18801.1 glucanase [Kineosporia sp. NBRC 101677]
MKRRTTVIISAATALAIGGAVTQSLVGHAEPAAPAAAVAGKTSVTTVAPAAEAAPAAAAVKGLPKTMTFYADPKSGPATWVAQNAGDSRKATIKAKLSSKPSAKWFGNWSGSIRPAVNTYVSAAAKKKKTPILVAYNIPGRDACGGHSSGGTAVSEYRTWIKSFANGVGKRRALVVLEPDSLADFQCMSTADATTRTKLLSYATEQFKKSAPNAYVYLDAGNSNWASAQDMSGRLVKAGLKNVRGFSLNVSNYRTTAQENAYAAKVNAELRKRGAKAKPYVVDTSRNGNGSNGEWCNPAGRKLGAVSQVNKKPTAKTPEARLWIKTPGESDGNCGIASGTAAGVFDPQIAVSLIKGQ